MSYILDFIFNHTPLFYLTQSIWRDEGFSYFMAKPNLFKVVTNSINDFNPPLYYIVLHFWMKIFGEGDMTLRMLSFVFHLSAVYIAFLLAKKIFSVRFAYFVALFTFFNPMLIYYAFEMRMYSLFTLFTFASLYYFMEKKWRKYVIITTLGMYTHSFFIFVIFGQLVYLFITKQFKRHLIIHLIKPIFLFIPWLPFLVWQFGQTKNSWIYPVDGQLIKSVLGNLFTGYEGSPGGLWGLTALLSLIILLFVYLGIKRNKKIGLLFSIIIFIPLFLVLSFSILRKPIYVNRYVIFVTVGEILAICLGIWSIRDKKVRKAVMCLWMILILLMNIFASQFHKKVDFRSTTLEITKLAKSTDYVYAQTPLSYFETAFYFPRRDKVYIYNPKNIAVPYYIGTAVISKDRSIADFPPSPARTYLIHDDGSYEMIIKTASVKMK